MLKVHELGDSYFPWHIFLLSSEIPSNYNICFFFQLLQCHTDSVRRARPGWQTQTAGLCGGRAGKECAAFGEAEYQTFGACPSDGATSAVHRLPAQTELLLRDAQATDERGMYPDTQTDTETDRALTSQRDSDVTATDPTAG